MDPQTPPANIEIVKFELARPSPEKNPATAIVRLKNNGGKIARTIGRLQLMRQNGAEILRMDVGEFQPELILPGSEREFRLPLGVLDEGEFRVLAEFATLGKDAVQVKDEQSFKSIFKMPGEVRQ